MEKIIIERNKMDVYKACIAYRKLEGEKIPPEEELAELYCLASSPNANIPENMQDEYFREFFKKRPFMRCLGILGAYVHLASRADDAPEMNTYAAFRNILTARSEEVGLSGRVALEDFLKDWKLSEFDAEMYLMASESRN